MRGTFLLLIIILLRSLVVSAQGLNNLWLAGYENPHGTPVGGLTINFVTGTPNIYEENRLLNFSGTNAIISDLGGNYLFASNGVFIENSNNDTMINGSGLNPSPWTSLNAYYGLTLTQGNLIIPVPLDSSKYYLFHLTIDDYGSTNASLFLYYSTIDMSLQGGLGEVIQKNVILLNDSLVCGKITACKHSNGRDWWLVCHQNNTNLFYKFLITPYTILGPYSQSIGEVRKAYLGQSKFSQDGKLFAYYDPGYGDLDIFDFDRCSGTFSLKAHVDINDSSIVGGVEFSPNSSLLYVSSNNYIYQFDLTVSNISSTLDTIAAWDGYYSPSPPFASTFYLAQLALDGKIYLTCGNSTVDMHVINNPNIKGDSSGVCQHCIHLPRYNGFTIPNYPNYFLGSESGSVCDSLIGVNDLTSKTISISIFPNPVEHQNFSVSYPVSSSTSILDIYNVNGNKVATYLLPQWSSFQRIEIPNLVSGVYMVKLTNSEYSGSTKFFIY